MSQNNKKLISQKIQYIMYVIFANDGDHIVTDHSRADWLA